MRRVWLVALVSLAAAACGELFGVQGDAAFADAGETTDAAFDDAVYAVDVAPIDASANDEPDDEGGADGPIDVVPGRRYVFVSSTNGISGNFGATSAGPYGLANVVCNGDKGSLPGNYVAFLAGMPALTSKAEDWYLPSGKRVFAGATPPVPGGKVYPLVPIDENAQGDTSKALATWTGVDGLTCKSWQSNSAANNGGVGDPTLTGPGWDNSGSSECAFVHRFYCFEE